MIEENRRLHPAWHDKLWQGSAAWPYCLVNVRENSPLRMRMASLLLRNGIGGKSTREIRTRVRTRRSE
jgi:hypothetical protein